MGNKTEQIGEMCVSFELLGKCLLIMFGCDQHFDYTNDTKSLVPKSLSLNGQKITSPTFFKACHMKAINVHVFCSVATTFITSKWLF